MNLLLLIIIIIIIWTYCYCYYYYYYQNYYYYKFNFKINIEFILKLKYNNYFYHNLILNLLNICTLSFTSTIICVICWKNLNIVIITHLSRPGVLSSISKPVLPLNHCMFMMIPIWSKLGASLQVKTKSSPKPLTCVPGGITIKFWALETEITYKLQ